MVLRGRHPAKNKRVLVHVFTAQTRLIGCVTARLEITMTDLRTRLTDALRSHATAQLQNWETKWRCECGDNEFSSKLEWAQHLADVLSSEFDIRERIIVTRDDEFELPWA
jgi:hypothetical protein